MVNKYVYTSAIATTTATTRDVQRKFLLVQKLNKGMKMPGPYSV